MKRITAGPSLIPRRRAMATITVVMMLMLVASAAVAMSALFATEARRTHAAKTQAQERQLLLAGAAYAETELAARGNAVRNIDVPLPPSVEGTLRLHIEPGPTSAEAAVQIQATVAAERARQTLTFTRTAETWRITSATLLQ